MKRIKDLDIFQQGLLAAMAVMVLVFSVLYPIALCRKGIKFRNALLVRHAKNGTTVYSGRVNDQDTSFTVSPDGTIFYRHGSAEYGPYTVREDPTAIPKDDALSTGIEATGIEVFLGDEVIFRGGASTIHGFLMLTDENGNGPLMDDNMVIPYGNFTIKDGMLYDVNGKMVDNAAPSVSSIVNLFLGLKLTHKGIWELWLYGVLVCALNVFLILYADELFRICANRWLRNGEDAEPSDWAKDQRFYARCGLAVCALILFIIGLQ